MVVLVGSASYGAQAVMAVGKHKWNRKFIIIFFGGSYRLHYAHIGDIVGDNGVKFNF